MAVSLTAHAQLSIFNESVFLVYSLNRYDLVRYSVLPSTLVVISACFCSATRIIYARAPLEGA